MNEDEHQALVNERAKIQARIGMIDSLEKNNPGSHILLTERNRLMQRLDTINTKTAFHYAAQDATKPRSQV